jgi:hypothetical protein
MLDQLVLGRAIAGVAHIDLDSVASERCARRERHLRWLRRCFRIRGTSKRQPPEDIPSLLRASAGAINRT